MDMMSIRRRVMLGSRKKKRLPDEYQEVEWICGNGGYIDTGYLPKITNSVELVYEFSPSMNRAILFGIDYTAHMRANYAYGGNYWYGYIGGELFITPKELKGYGTNKDTLYTMSLNKDTFSINDIIVPQPTRPYNFNTPNTYTAYLFAGNNQGVASDIATYMRVYSFKIFENNIIVLDFVPCYRKSDNEIGMYDTVSKFFFTNAGTGTFLKGADV